METSPKQNDSPFFINEKTSGLSGNIAESNRSLSFSKRLFRHFILWLFIAGIFWKPTPASSQIIGSHDLDSLWAVWNDNSQDDTARLNALYRICWDGFMDISNDSLFNLAQIVYDLADSMNNKKFQADALNIQGYAFYIRGDYEKAKEYYEKSFQLSKDAGCSNRMAISYGYIGNIFKVQGNRTKALEYLEQCLELEQEMGNRKGMSGTYNDIGRIYLSEGVYNKALDYFNRSLKIRKEINDKRGMAWSYNNIGFTYLNLSNYTQALNFLERSLEINNKLGYNTGIAFNKNNLGLLFYQQKLYLEALQYFQNSLDIFETTGDKFGVSMVSVNIGEVKIQQYKFDESIEWCEKGFVLAEDMGALEEEIKACDCLYKANKGLGRGMQALKFYERLIILQENLKLDKTEIKLQQIEFKRQRQADSLIQVEEKLKSEIAYQVHLNKDKNTRNTLILSGFGILLLAAGLFSRILFIRKTNKKLEKKNRVIAMEKERAEESEQAKEQFFDNISHEFRTPITLILGPLDEALESSDDEAVRNNLTIAQRNAQRLETMIDELLDLSKLEFGKIKLEAKEEGIVRLINEYLQSFQSLAEQRRIKLSLESDAEEYNVFIDSEKIRKILNNLLFNACKFTEDGGVIKVTVSSWQSAADSQQSKVYSIPTEDWRQKTVQRTTHAEDLANAQEGILISVSDTGIGIPQNQLEKVFDRFHQVNDPKGQNNKGTGIGLALTKELVELHHGKIWAESEQGKGTVINIILPLGRDHLSPEEIKTEEIADEEKWIIEKEISGKKVNDKTTSGIDAEPDLPILLIVEDNIDMRSFICQKFVNHYSVLEAGDGEEGLKKATEHIPDLIICDIMMPKMNGIEMTRSLKKDERTSHVPVIMLTARASTESRIEGLETGADAYVTKPFNAQELAVRVKKLIEQRKKLRALFSEKLESLDDYQEKDPQLPSMDQQFIQKAIEVVSEHISDKDFDANTFASEMAMSRVQLHRKITALTNKTTTEFMRTMRLKRGAELLKRQTGNVTEIALEVGFSSLSYFTKVFKEQFGVTPSEFIGKGE